MPGIVNVHPIFWDPAGYTITDPLYKSLIIQYYNDVGNHNLYTLLLQYPGSNGTPSSAIDAGSWEDTTTPYPSSCSPSSCNLSVSDMADEITWAIQTNGWSTGYGNLYVLYTGPGATLPNWFCGGFHAFYGQPNSPTIYAYITYVTQGCFPSHSPNNDPAADGAVNTSAHEQFEATTDPHICTVCNPQIGGNGWTENSNVNPGEIGDICAGMFDPLNFDGGQANQEWNGHDYIIQKMWDNSHYACSEGLT